MKKPPSTPIDPREDIEDQATREKFMKAAVGQRKLVDDPEERKRLAGLAQDHLIALRALKVPYNAHAVSLQRAVGDVLGDLYIYGKPCHPRDAGEQLAAGDTVADLTDLVNELKAKLDYEVA